MRMQSLAHEWQQLIRWMQEINYGRIEKLCFADGTPCFDPAPRVVREFKVGGENDPRPEALLEDFDLKREIVEFHNDMTRRGNVVIESLEIKHGVPFRWCVEVDLAT